MGVSKGEPLEGSRGDCSQKRGVRRVRAGRWCRIVPGGASGRGLRGEERAHREGSFNKSLDGRRRA